MSRKCSQLRHYTGHGCSCSHILPTPAHPTSGRNDDGQFGTDRQPVTYQLNMAYYAYLSVHLA